MANPRKEFSKIYDQYIDKIYRFVFLKVSSKDIAQDICSETFIKCWEFYKNKNNTIENHQAFIYRVARNLVTDYYRKKGRTQVVSAENIPIYDPEANLEEKAIFASDLGQVKLALNDLKEDYQNVIVWHYLDDLPIKKVAEMMNKSEQNTRVILHRALKSLKNRVKEV
ncbi:MAG: sigma-70 family RNA polymerase sigma factor [bacterium]